jgi:hypothetical protein
MSNYTATHPDRSLGTIIKDLTADLSNLVRSEIALLKLEVRQSIAKLGGGSAMLAAALFLGLVGMAFLFVTITLGMIALGLPPWLSSLIVTVVLFAAAGVLVMLGRNKLKDVNFVPSESIDHVRTDIDTLKADVARVRSR